MTASLLAAVTVAAHITVLSLAGWVVLGLPAMVVVTIAGSRLLGTRRGAVALTVAGIVGWTAAVLTAGLLTDWDWNALSMVLLALGFGTLFTMMSALAIDFLAPMGSLATGERVGVIRITNPLRTLRLQRARLGRYREVIRLGVQNGVVSRSALGADLPAGVRRTLEQAGGIFVKLGQVASTRTDLLPAAWCTELARLRSDAAPAAEDDVRPFLQDELGVAVERAYAAFDWDPIAAASIAQVYAATLHDGTDVVVKVQRPGLDDLMAVDRSAVMSLAGLVERRTELGLSVRPVDLAAQFLDDVAEELDFTVEAANAEELRGAMHRFDGVRIPAVFPELSTTRVITEERVRGTSIADVDHLRAAGLAPDAVARRLLDAFLTMIFDLGVFHADPHPGNILVEDDGTIVLIDLGAVGRLSPGQRTATLELLLAASAGDERMLRDALTEIVDLDDRADLRALDRALERFIARNVRAGGGITTTAFQDLATLTGQFGMRFPEWLATLVRTMVTLEGTLATVDPGFSLVDAAHEHAGDSIGIIAGPDGLRGVLRREALAQVPRLRRLPERVDAILGQAAEGRLTARVSVLDDRTERVVTRLFDRLVLGVLAAAVGVGSVLLLGVHAGPNLGSVSVNEVLGYIGLASSAVLAMRVIAGIVRDGST